jgi:hypothetical protein
MTYRKTETKHAIMKTKLVRKEEGDGNRGKYAKLIEKANQYWLANRRE